MQKWQYLIVDTNNTGQNVFHVMFVSSDREVLAADDKLRAMAKQDITLVMPYLGSQGWELVCCHPLKAFSINGQRMYFKRQK